MYGCRLHVLCPSVVEPSYSDVPLSRPACGPDDGVRHLYLPLAAATPRRKHQFAGLERKAWHHLTSRFPAVAQGSAQLAEMSAEELAHLLSADQLNTPSELFVWQCALHWVQHRPAERARHVPLLLAAVRLHYMDRRAFFRQVAKNPLVVADSLCQPAVNAALEFFYRRNAGLARAVEPRLPHQVMFVVGGWTDQGPTTHVETYDTKANEWQQVLVEDEAGTKVYHATAVLGHCIYVIGGFGNDEYYSTCQSFNVVTKAWADLSPMNARRYYLASAVLGNDIYAIGGLDGVRRHRSVEKYNPYDNQWRFVASMNSKRSDAGATEFNGKIYVVGGFDGFECVKSAEVYDPDADQWTFIRPMISRRSGITCVVYHGYIYTAGGYNGSAFLSCCERFNPVTNSWTSGHNMRSRRGNLALGVVNDKIYAIGGSGGNYIMKTVEHFDDSTNEWLPAADLRVARYGTSAVVVEDIPNVLDYVKRKLAVPRVQASEKIGSSSCADTQTDRSHHLNTSDSEDGEV